MGDPGATDRVVDSSRLDDRIDALKSRVGKILQRFERRVGREGASNSSGAEERRRRANTRLAQEIQGVRDEVAGMAERSDRMTESLRRIQRDIVASTRRRVPEAGNGSSLRRRPREPQRQHVLSDHIDLASTVVTDTHRREFLRRGSLRDWLSDVLNDGDAGEGSDRGLSARDVAALGSCFAVKALENPCCICLEPIDEGNKVTRLQCCHVFHTSCIGRWLRQAASCPLCMSAVHA